MNDPKNLLQANAELFGNALQREGCAEIDLPDLSHVVIGQLRHPVPASLRPLHSVIPAFPSAIGVVVLLGAEEQVIGPNTSRHIAVMAYEQTIGDRAEVEFPRHPMSAGNA